MIVGGGPAGVSAAIHLTRAGISVGIITTEASSDLAGEHVAPQGRLALQDLGVHASNGFIKPSYGVEASWGRDEPILHSQITDPFGEAWRTDRPKVNNALLQLAVSAGVTVLHRHRFVSVTKRPEGWSVLHRGATINTTTCRFIIDATGRWARVARAMGAHRQRLDMLCGIASVLQTRQPAGVLRVEATAYGWWYAVTLPNEQTLVALISDADILRRLDAFDASTWSQLVSRTRLASAVAGPANSIVAYPCETMTLDHVVGTGWLAVGDAAAVFDPLSSLGVSKALQSGRDAARAVQEHFAGSTAALSHYAHTRTREFATYLKDRERHYAIESRWRHEPFWQRRAA